jgi:hypothetical protein
LTVDIRTFTTEAATQLPNADMESWYRVAGQTDYWWIDYPGAGTNAVWGTNNLMTTSQGGSNTTATSNRNGCAYSTSSGTIYTDDVHGGSKAALIRTIGWGSGNNAVGTGNFITPVTCKYIDAGLLHLGTGRTARETGNTDRAGSLDQTGYDSGLSFGSRPSSFSFWYKYTAKNSDDHGVAEIAVYDANNNVIASGSAELTSSSEYIQKTISLTYNAGVAKAAKIYVKFMSTYSTDFLALNTSNISYPTYANLSDAMYLGSQLYVDDLTLNY